jgi:hypothetical protein
MFLGIRIKAFIPIRAVWSYCVVHLLVPLPKIDIVFSKSIRVLEDGITAVLKRLNHKSQGYFLEVAVAYVFKVAQNETGDFCRGKRTMNHWSAE